jgi:phage-related protein
MDKQRGDASTSVSKARDAQVTAFRDHPRQGAIQPVEVDETFDAAPESEPVEPLEEMPDQGMADYVASPLPEDVRAAADGKLAKTLDASLTGPRADVTAAATTRDTDKAAAIATAEEDAAKINTDADADQKKAVLDNRAEVARLQGEGMTEAHGAVNAFNRDAGTQQAATRKTIGTHVRTEEEKARGEITKGETKAEDLKATAETDAKAEKDALKEEEKKDSWWEKGKAFLKSAVKAVTDAIDKIFTALRKAVAEVIEAAKNAAIGLINAARDFAITQINDFRDWAKKQVDTYVADTFPNLAKRINGAIDTVADTAVTVVNAVADTAVAAVEFVADTLAKTLDGLLKAFQTGLKAAVRIAAAAATGDFAEALRVAIEAACEIAGIDSKPVFDFFDRAGKAVDSILKDPVTFFSNLAGAVGAGIGAFFTNIRTHLISGAIAWLTGALAEVQLTGPFEFTVSGILKIVLQILGLTYDAIKARVIKAYPPAGPMFDVIEKGFEIVKKLVTEGPMSLLDEILAHLGDLKETVMGAVREWLIVTAIKQGIVWLLALTNPASAIVKAVMLVYDLVMFLVERFQQIKDFVMSIYDAVAAVAAGNFSAVTTKVEEALSRSVPVLISLLASVLSLGNIAAKVKAVIAKVTKPINKVINAVVKKIVAFAKKVAKKVGKLATKAKKKAKKAAAKAKQKAKETAKKIKDFLWPKKKFQVEGQKHTLMFEKQGGRHVPFIRSTPTALTEFVAAWKIRAGSNLSKRDQGHITAAETAIATLVTLGAEVDTLEAEKTKASKSGPEVEAKLKAKYNQMLTAQTAVAKALKGLLGRKDDIAEAEERYKLEGLAGTYATVPNPTKDQMTGDHQPQAAAIKLLATRDYFATKAEGAKMVHRAGGGKHAGNAYVINLHENRHMEGRTYGQSISKFESLVDVEEKKAKTPEAARKATVLLLKKELEADVKAMRAVYKTKEKTMPAPDPIWGDLDSFAGGDQAVKAKLAQTIRSQVAQGETLLEHQPMNELAG